MLLCRAYAPHPWPPPVFGIRAMPAGETAGPKRALVIRGNPTMLDIDFGAPPETSREAMPSLNHSYLCTRIMQQLLRNPALLPLTELTLDIENGLTPAISVYPGDAVEPDFLNDVIRYEPLPIMAIEVVSASQTIQTLLNKAKKLAESGVPTVLTVEPYSRTVFLTRRDGETQILHNQAVDTGDIHIDFPSIFEKRPVPAHEPRPT